MQTPFHPLVSHFPLALTFVTPFILVAVAFLIRSHKMTPKGLFLAIGLQLFTTASGYLALETGENEERTAAKVVDRRLIHAHEEAAEVFVGLTVVILAVAVASFFIRREFQLRVQLGAALLGVLAMYFAYRTGTLGGELVYRHGAAGAYAAPDAVTPAPTVEETNESLKVDEYGDDANGDPEEEPDKVED